MTDDKNFLNVASSLSGRRWASKPVDERLALTFAQRLGIPDVLARVLSARGVRLDDAERFLDPTLRDFLPDPAHLKDMDGATERLASAVMSGELIAIFGDYDVDGATSSALLARFVHAVGGRALVYIPDRLREGYGPNAAAMARLKEQGASVVVTVDCGTAAFASLDAAVDLGLEVIVIDHHTAEPALPKAVAIVNPNRLDEHSPHGNLAAVGVTFLLVVGANRVLRNAGWYKTRPAPDPLQWLDIVALGTVCDVVPLTGVNRALVAQGLKVMALRRNVGMSALVDVARIDEKPNAYHAGFVLGPRINAGGRVGASDLGARLLRTDDPEEAKILAHRLDELNRERQDIEGAVLEQALAQAEAHYLDDPVLVVAAKGWHPGVVGIVASRLKERFNRPACVVALAQGQGTASGRSILGVDLGAAVIAARQAGILVKGGGHAMAAGFTVAEDRLDDLRRFFADRLAEQVIQGTRVNDLYLDGAMEVRAATVALVETLSRLGPFGSGNPEPRFALVDVGIAKADPVGKARNHVRCILRGKDGATITAIAFRAMDSDLGPGLLAHGGRPFHMAGKLRINEWNGNRRPQLLIDDAAPIW
ncbi:single-stranded-DNA-specific exonuclease RecJ [Varunaivibrio sulfuroxidans]|uniref:Single-stranded-DNA-specific exonuclease RecJ n=1 Tax=Varunaivibrio sulfuroxidans TaxID=1773489 RepID=A0A4R3JEU7_9PROT|nr:single-stranded-DNA-specific exonuclease RecJ [Varunaivibrio sulfuroxidans]TCS64344.1 exonuclease RecJ [Varunaivibrio sulfuroxidans]WES31219.1 single-stranded-DNA-specific exonuclease RecJ [Varunaivibrio sulfuroxidans]